MANLIDMDTVEHLILRGYAAGNQRTAGELIEYLRRKTKGSTTAYDPEKVIEKLQVLSDKADDDIAVCEADTCQYYDGYGDGLDRAIEIVKRGGRDEE